MSGQRSLRGRGGCYGASGAAAFTAAAATPEPAGGPEVLPSAAARDIAVAGSGGGSCRGRRVFPPPRPAVLGSPARPTSSAPLPLTLRASSPAPTPTPRLRRPSGAARLQLTGLESRLGAPDSRPPAPFPSPRPEPPDAAAAASFERGPGPAAATAAAAELRRRRRRRAPWETPGASAAKRPVCRLAVPAASGGPARL